MGVDQYQEWLEGEVKYYQEKRDTLENQPYYEVTEVTFLTGILATLETCLRNYELFVEKTK